MREKIFGLNISQNGKDVSYYTNHVLKKCLENIKNEIVLIAFLKDFVLKLIWISYVKNTLKRLHYFLMFNKNDEVFYVFFIHHLFRSLSVQNPLDMLK